MLLLGNNKKTTVVYFFYLFFKKQTARTSSLSDKTGMRFREKERKKKLRYVKTFCFFFLSFVAGKNVLPRQKSLLFALRRGIFSSVGGKECYFFFKMEVVEEKSLRDFFCRVFFSIFISKV